MATVAYWIIAPDEYARQMFGDTAINPGHRYLVWQTASVVATMLVWFYGRVLFAPSIELRTFRYLQEGMALGDAGILALSAYLALAARPHPGMLTMQVFMAALWGGIRVVFLWRHREHAAGALAKNL
jgi:hypothetical protein